MTNHSAMTRWSVAFLCGFLSCSTQAEDGEARVLMAQQQFEDWRFVTLLEGKDVHSIVAFNLMNPAQGDHTLWLMPDVSWYHPGGFAAARSAGVLEVKLVGGVSGTSVLLNQSLALHESGQNFVGGTLTPAGPGVTVTFTPREISSETVHCEAAPFYDSVRSISPTLMVRCWSHIKAAAYTNCWSRAADHWGPEGVADVLGWQPNYTMTIDNDAEECSGLPEVRRF